MSNFFKEFNIRKGFSSKGILSDKRTVCIKHTDGRITEHHGITNPWKYIAKVKKEMGIETVWLKED